MGLATQDQGQADLQATQDKIESSVPEKYQRGFKSIMAAGLKMMFSDKTFPEMQQYVESLKSPDQIAPMVSHGITKAMSLLINVSKGKMPMEPMGAAAQSLMIDALQYVEKQKGMPISNDILAQTTKMTNQGVMHLLQQYSGLNPQQFEQVMRGQGKQLMAQGGDQPVQQSGAESPDQSAQQDPTAMAGA